MNDDIIEPKEDTPSLTSKKCKYIAVAVEVALKTSIYLLTALAWIKYDYFAAIATLLLAFIVMGVLRSKMKVTSIPSKQLEFDYSDKDIAIWYTSKNLCDDILESRLEKI